MRSSVHQSVLPVEVLQYLDPKPGEIWVDATTGAGGHAALIAGRIAPDGQLIALDQDAGMLELAKARFEGLPGLPPRCVPANFDQLVGVLDRLKLTHVDGVLADLGICSDQLDDAQRGFSFQKDAPLDMRLDPTIGASAADLIANCGEVELADYFYRYGEERLSRRVAKKIVEAREIEPITTTFQLAALVRKCVPASGKIDPSTRVFQGLRIAVNDELGCLERLLAQLPRLVKSGGRIGIISFHSLEDRIVKHSLQDEDIWQTLTKKPVQASPEEISRNPRSRSAKLRTARRR